MVSNLILDLFASTLFYLTLYLALGGDRNTAFTA